MLVELHKYTLEKGWELVHSYGEGKITAQLEEDVNIHSRTDLFGYLLVLTEGQDPYLCVYFHNGNKMVHPSIVKEQSLPEPTLAQKFLAGIPSEVIEQVASIGLKAFLQEMIINFATDDAHEVYPLEFFSETIIDLAGGEDAPEFEGYTLTGNDYEDYEDESEFPEDPSLHFNDEDNF